MSYSFFEDEPWHVRTRGIRYALPLAEVREKPKPRKERKKVGKGFTASELQAIREIERERKPIPSFDQLVREHRNG